VRNAPACLPAGGCKADEKGKGERPGLSCRGRACPARLGWGGDPAGRSKRRPYVGERKEEADSTYSQICLELVLRTWIIIQSGSRDMLHGECSFIG